MMFQSVLFVGPNYLDHKGGIGAVLEVYSKNIGAFKFVASYDGNFRGIRNIIKFAGALMKIFWRLSVDKRIKIVHIHGASKGSFIRKYYIFLMVKYLFNKKVVYHIHGGGFKTFYLESWGKRKKRIEHFINGSDALICLSKYWKRFFEDNFNQKHVVVIRNPIESVAICNRTTASQVRFLFLGKICDAKGVFDLLCVILKHRAFYEHRAVFKFGGNGEVERLKLFIKEHQLEDLVHYEGWVGVEQKHQLMLHSDAYILPSYVEGVPMSILEAMNYGLPVIATNVGGIPEMLENEVNGLMFTPGDRQGLHKAIDYMMIHPDRRAEMGSAGKIISGAYDIFEILPELNELYGNVLR